LKPLGVPTPEASEYIGDTAREKERGELVAGTRGQMNIVCGGGHNVLMVTIGKGCNDEGRRRWE
jgi:hypothetical protein